MARMDWFGFLLPRFNPRRGQADSLSPPHEEDLDRLDELRQQGSRLDLPHPVRGFLVFATEAASRDAAATLGKEGFSCSVRASQDGAWVTTAVTRLVPRPGAITKLREQLEAVGKVHGGSYRGWDAPVVY